VKRQVGRHKHEIQFYECSPASVLPPVGLKVGRCDDGIGVGALLGDDVNVGDAVGS
jgi:hypothetical protein